MSTAAKAPPLIKLLADDLRWRIVTTLAQSDRRGQDLVRLLQRPQNLVSYHLKQLRQHNLVAERRSAADGRDRYFSLRLDAVQRLYQETGQALHPALPDAERQPQSGSETEGRPPTRVLFLCTHNSARSQMAEAILRHLGGGAIEAYSAGNQPSDIHPLARRALRERGIPMDGQRSKLVSEFEGQHFDYIVTVCDVARESCPVFPGDPEQIHWSFADPAAANGLEARERAFHRTATELTTRINYLLLLIHRQRRGDLGHPAG
jgi:protein-tyrosine-phosphatase